MKTKEKPALPPIVYYVNNQMHFIFTKTVLKSKGFIFLLVSLLKYVRMKSSIIHWKRSKPVKLNFQLRCRDAKVIGQNLIWMALNYLKQFCIINIARDANSRNSSTWYFRKKYLTHACIRAFRNYLIERKMISKYIRWMQYFMAKRLQLFSLR